MLSIHTSLKNTTRHWKKSSLAVLIACLLVMFLYVYIGNIRENEVHLARLGDAMPVAGRITNADGSQDVALQIDMQTVRKMLASDYVKEERITTQGYFDLGTQDKDTLSWWPECHMIGTNTIGAFTAFSAEDVEYLAPYGADVLTSSEPICILRDVFMEEKALHLGDPLQITLYAPRYDASGGYTFTFEKVGVFTLKIIGQYRSNIQQRQDDLPEMILPMASVEAMYQEGQMVCFADSVKFALRDPLQINDFKAEMLSLGFKSTNMQEGFARVGNALLINDETFIRSATQISQSLDLLKRFAPLMFFLVAAIGFVSSYLLMQSRQGELAIMRSLGTSKRQCFGLMFLEMGALNLLGGLLGLMVSALTLRIPAEILWLVLPAFSVIYLLGTAVALLALCGFSVMAILSKTE